MAIIGTSHVGKSAFAMHALIDAMGNDAVILIDQELATEQVRKKMVSRIKDIELLPRALEYSEYTGDDKPMFNLTKPRRHHDPQKRKKKRKAQKKSRKKNRK